MAGVITPSPMMSDIPINDRSVKNATCLSGGKKWRQEFSQHDGSTLPALTEAHGQPRIFDGNEDYKGPDNKGKDADDIGFCRLGQNKNNSKGINRARSDIAEH